MSPNTTLLTLTLTLTFVAYEKVKNTDFSQAVYYWTTNEASRNRADGRTDGWMD